MFTFTVSVSGEEQLARGFSRFGEAVSDYSPVWRELADDFLKVERDQFVSEGRSGSGGWVPLSPGYAAWKAKHTPGRPLLVQSGKLRQSLTEHGGEHIEEIRKDSLRLGTGVPYAIYHQAGTRHMPARKLVELSEADKTRWTKKIQSFIVQEAKAQGLL